MFWVFEKGDCDEQKVQENDPAAMGGWSLFWFGLFFGNSDVGSAIRVVILAIFQRMGASTLSLSLGGCAALAV